MSGYLIKVPEFCEGNVIFVDKSFKSMKNASIGVV